MLMRQEEDVVRETKGEEVSIQCSNPRMLLKGE